MWPVGDAHVEFGLPRDQLGQAAQQGAAAAQCDPGVDEVRREFRRRAFEHGLDRADHLAHRLHQRFAHVGGADDRTARQVHERIAPADLDLDLLFERQAAPGRDLEALGRDLADQQVVLGADVLRDRFVEVVSGHAQTLGHDDVRQRDHRDLAGAAADVDDHRAGRLAHGQARPDRRGHRLLDQIRLARAGRETGLLNRALLNPGHP